MRPLKYLLLLPCLLHATVQIPINTAIPPATFTGLTLDEFGALTQTNRTLQLEARFSEDVPLRTNDFQPLQQNIATARQVVRMGYFYVNQGTTGAGLVIPSSQANTANSITTPTNDLQLIIAATQTTDYRILTSNPTTQSFQVNYSVSTDPPPTTFDSNQTLTDFQIIGNAFHDYRYVNLTPQITFDGATVVAVAQTGTKFRLTMSNGQILLLYFENSTSPVTLTLNFARTQLTASFPFTGFLRIAAVQPAALPQLIALIDLAPFNPWATSIVNQTRPATPIAMFMLWPVSWTTLVGTQIRTNLANPNLVPSCEILADVLPVYARTNFRSAEDIALQLGNRVTSGETNLFNTFFNMIAANRLSAEIAAYQASIVIPPYVIAASNATVEAIYDAFRTIIPITADIAFESDQYTWTYTCLNNLTAPLIIFPAYKRVAVAPAPQPLTGYAYQDPIKGQLLGVAAIDNTITFTEGAEPAFWTADNIFPSTLRFSGDEVRTLDLLFSAANLDTITGTDVITAGRQIYTLAYTASAWAFVLQQTGSGASIAGATGAMMNRVKIALRQWLITHISATQVVLPDFFVSDTLTGGVCTSVGMGGLNTQTASADEFNALYSNHHLQYGYFLAAAALVVRHDDLVRSANPFITETFALPDGTTAIAKEFIDMLWRDARNFNTLDPQLPFNRHGNPWEGHSTANGILYDIIPEGRFEERFGEDFNSWVAVNLYARAILATPALTTAQKVGMQELADFSLVNMKLTATSSELVFQDADWLYTAPYATDTITVGQVFDTQTLATTTLQPGIPCPVITTR